MTFPKVNNLLLLMLCVFTGISASAIEKSDTFEVIIPEQPVLTASENFGVEEELADRINSGHLLYPEGASAYDTYISYVESYPEDVSRQRSLKRTLVAALAEVADQALTEYFDYGGEFVYSYMSNSSENRFDRIVPLDQYYFVAADLSGTDHFLYDGLQSKGLFIEALKFRYLSNQGFQVVESKLKQSLSLTPDASYTYHELGVLYFDEGYYSEACANLKLAVRLNPKWTIPRELLAEAEIAISSSKND